MYCEISVEAIEMPLGVVGLNFEPKEDFFSDWDRDRQRERALWGFRLGCSIVTNGESVA